MNSEYIPLSEFNWTDHVYDVQGHPCRLRVRRSTEKGEEGKYTILLTSSEEGGGEIIIAHADSRKEVRGFISGWCGARSWHLTPHVEIIIPRNAQEVSHA